MNLSNKIENRILIIGSMALTILGFWLVLKLFIVPTYTAQIEFLQKQNAAKDATITELAKIAKYSIQNDFGRMKAKDGQIVLDLNNKLDVDSKEIVIPESNVHDSLTFSKNKQSLWKKIF
jgi:hypothetical protein